jgi:hypothetical protein
MKTKKVIFWFPLFVIILAVTVSSCEKSNTSDYRKLIGSWISTDLIDTIDFTSDKDLYKMYSGIKDHFDYSLSRDSIIIQYNGFRKILVQPTIHFYSLKTDELTIDFGPGCYGFREQKITFIRK